MKNTQTILTAICMRAGSHSAQQSYFDLSCFCQSTIIVSLYVMIHTFLQTNTEFSVSMLVVGNKFQSFQSAQCSVQVPLRGTYMFVYKNNIVLLKAC